MIFRNSDLLIVEVGLGRGLLLFFVEIVTNFSNWSKVIDFLHRGRLFDPLNLEHEFDNLLLVFRIDCTVRGKAGQNQVIDFCGQVVLNLHELR